MSGAFSKQLIKEYQQEMQATYGLIVSDADADRQLRSLVRTFFGNAIAEDCSESRKSVQVRRRRTCGDLLSGRLGDGVCDEVGASITPTSGHKFKRIV